MIHPGEFCLGRTLEWVELPDDIVARIEGKSSLGRLGLIVHATAGFCDPGWKGTLTLELNNLTRVPIKLYPGLPIAQLSFMALDRPALRPYGSPELGSHYQGQRAATESRYEGGPRGAAATRSLGRDRIGSRACRSSSSPPREPSKVPFYIAGGVLARLGGRARQHRAHPPEFPYNERGQRGVIAITLVLVVIRSTAIAVASNARSLAAVLAARRSLARCTRPALPADGYWLALGYGPVSSAASSTPGNRAKECHDHRDPATRWRRRSHGCRHPDDHRQPHRQEVRGPDRGRDDPRHRAAQDQGRRRRLRADELRPGVS